MKKRSTAAFSLVELTLAIGIAAFCLIAVVGLMPVGMLMNRNATSQTAATNILSTVVSDIRASPKALTSVLYKIKKGKANFTTVCFDGQGGVTLSTPAKNPPCPANSRYRLYVQIYPAIAQLPSLPTYAWLKVTWPAAVDPLSTTVTPSGSVETVATFFAN